eukprot:gene11724-18076_t
MSASEGTSDSRARCRTVTLLAIPSMARLAQRVEAIGQGKFALAPLQFETFDDGTPNASFDVATVYNKDVVFLCDYDITTLGAQWVGTLAVIYSLPRYGCRSLMVVMPFFPVGTMERVSS